MREWLKPYDSSGSLDDETYQSAMKQIEEIVERGSFSVNGKSYSFRTDLDKKNDDNK